MPELSQIAIFVAVVEAAGIWWAIWENTQISRFNIQAKITERYQNLLSEVTARPDLGNIESFSPVADEGVTPDQRAYVCQRISQSLLVFHTPGIRKILPRHKLKKDVGKFLSYPVPNEVWKSIRGYYDNKFVEFVESARSASSGES